MKIRHLFLAMCILCTFGLFAGNDYPIQPVPFTAVRVTDNFFAPFIKRNHDVTIPIALKHCYNSGRVDNFLIAGGWKKGQFQSDLPFDDSDIYKIIEGASYTLQTIPDKEMDAHLDALIFYIQQAQEKDGYLFTNRTINPDSVHAWVDKERWLKDWDLSHELYNLGHLYEAAAAHYQATGKRNLLDIAIKSANLVCKDFGPGKLAIAPGHQVIEMGLVKLYRVTGEKKYLDMAKFFLDIRGANKEQTRGEYCQDHCHVVDQETAVGHSVRACYMYAGMADVAALMNVPAYINALDKIWDDITYKKYYITGGIGAAAGHEGFGPDYELPNMSAYNETCAAISEIFWNQRMFLLEGNSKFYDILERTLYNGTLSGVSLSGDHFFYPNPLESIGQHARSTWFGCACCPSNVCRFIPSIPGYMYATDKDRLYVNLFIQSEADITLNGKKIKVNQSTQYPWNGAVDMTFEGQTGHFEVAVRIPGWAKDEVLPSDLYTYAGKSKEKYTITINGEKVPYTIEKGYALIRRNWKTGEKLSLNFPMPVKKVIANKNVKADIGKMALERGPIVYCLEWPDNENEKVRNIIIQKGATLQTQFNPTLLNGVQTVTGQGEGTKMQNGKVVEQKQTFTAIPYYAWANRGSGEMMVWIPFEKGKANPIPAPSIASQSKAASSHKSISLVAINDQNLPTSSNGRDYPYFHWWGSPESSQWVEYAFNSPQTVSYCGVYWYDDSPWGGCKLPQRWKVLYKDSNGKWIPVKNKSPYPIEKDKFSDISFEPVNTSGLRLEIESAEGYAGGIHEWVLK